ncbi:MAG: UTP--glucose-1-phosphate uridylyltransferase [Verrucomicrobiota bacterium]
MKSSDHIAQLFDRLRKAGQEHLIRRLESLDPKRADRLQAQLEQLNWERLAEWADKYVRNYAGETVPESVEPAPYYPLEPTSDEQKKRYDDACEQAENLLRNGQVGAFTVAGGQGTRLGFDAPKGTFGISPVRGKSLFQLFAESILGAQKKYSAEFSWYIMTSPLNDRDTRDFFEQNDYFGLRDDQVMFFPQGTLPAMDFNGRVLLAAPDELALSPDGHGGSLAALRNSGALDDMRERGITHISYFQVDNPLVHIFDPLFIGLHDLTGSEMSSRCLIKTGPQEKLGNFCIVDGRVQIVEYSDMPTELAEEKTTDGQLRFRAGSPAIHLLSRRFVERVTEGGLHLPIHRAVKKVPFVNDDDQLVTPGEPNAIKFETFVFDAIPMAKNPLILEADRREQFGPVKNPAGVDSVESCRELMNERAARWLEHAGLDVPRTPEGNVDAVIELSPCNFPDAETVQEQAHRLKPPRRNAKEYYQ